MSLIRVGCELHYQVINPEQFFISCHGVEHAAPDSAS